MTTEFICTIKNTGGDYGTLIAWESANQCDLTSALVFSTSSVVGTVAGSVTGQTSGATGTATYCTLAGQILIHTITGTFQSGETVQVNASNYVILANAGDSPISVVEIFDDFGANGCGVTCRIEGWTMDATRYCIIRAASGSEYNPITGTGSKLYRDGSNLTTNRIVIKGTARAHIKNLGILNPNNEPQSSFASSIIAADLADDTVVMRCTVDTDTECNVTGENSLYIGGLYSTTSNYIARFRTFRNCTFISFLTDGGNNGTSVLRNCDCTNCVIYNETPTIQRYFYECTGDFNASNDTSAPGANSIHNITTSEFLDFSNGDFSLSAGSQLIDAGTDLSSDFIDDIIGTVRG